MPYIEATYMHLLLSLVLIHRKPSAMGALRRRRPLAIYENAMNEN
jgi:hypothetical protein